MSVLEYAEDINKTVEAVLKECKKLGIDVYEEEDLLDDEGITLLHNSGFSWHMAHVLPYFFFGPHHVFSLFSGFAN